RKRESRLSISGCDDSRRLIGSRWIPAFAGMTNCTVTLSLTHWRPALRVRAWIQRIAECVCRASRAVHQRHGLSPSECDRLDQRADYQADARSRQQCVVSVRLLARRERLRPFRSIAANRRTEQFGHARRASRSPRWRWLI